MGPHPKGELMGLILKREALLQSGYFPLPDRAQGAPTVHVPDRSPRAAASHSHIMLQVTRMLISISIHWLITSHFLEPFHSYLY